MSLERIPPPYLIASRSLPMFWNVFSRYKFRRPGYVTHVTLPILRPDRNLKHHPMVNGFQNVDNFITPYDAFIFIDNIVRQGSNGLPI